MIMQSKLKAKGSFKKTGPFADLRSKMENYFDYQMKKALKSRGG
jgi:hypothetical protein